MSQILWEASARRMKLSDEYEGFKYEYPRGRVSFKSSQQGLDDEVDACFKAIRVRINGGLHLNSEDKKGPGRVGARWIHTHAEQEILELFNEIDDQLEHPLETKSYYLYARGSRTKVIAVKGEEGRALVFIVRNWINPLHVSELPRIYEALDRAEEILKKKGYTKVSKVLFTESLESQQTLNSRKDVYYYPLEYIQPQELNEIVKKETGIDLDPYYPRASKLNFSIRSLLKGFLYNLVTKRLFKKEHVQKERREQQQSTQNTRGFNNASFLISNVESSYSKLINTNQAYSVYEPSREIYQTENLLYIQEKDLEKGLESLPGPPGDPLNVRFTHQKKCSSRRVHNYLLGPYFYRNIKTWKGPRKLRLGTTPLEIARRRYITEKEALLQCVHALRNYHTRNILIKSKIREVLTLYLQRLKMIL